MTPEGLLVLAAVVSASGGGMAHAKEKRGCEEGADGGCREGKQRRGGERRGRGAEGGLWAIYRKELYVFGGE